VRETASGREWPFVIRDPLYGDIHLTDIERELLDSDLFQRQRGIKQLGTSMLLYPSAVQTRFVHALGNVEIVGHMFDRALGNASAGTRGAFLADARTWLARVAGSSSSLGRRIRAESDLETTVRIRQIARLAGMCHDLGHFPMGHVLEYALQDPAVT
jgi:HD superfamily phosphohydrolase